MPVSSFLAEGATIPQGSAVTDITKQSTLPDWYTNYAQDLLTRQKEQTLRPYTPMPMPRVANLTANERAGYAATRNAVDTYKPGLAAATQGTTEAMNAPGGMAAASPYLTRAGESTVANLGQYMNPFTESVVARIGELGQRNLTDVLMPQIEGRYIQSGQLGYGGGMTGTPSGMMTDTARAIRDTNSDILGKQLEALNMGYTQATGLSAADLDRAARLGVSAADIASADTRAKLEASKQLSGLAAAEQELGLTGAGALTAVGEKERAYAQKNIDDAVAEYMRQQNYPQEQIDRALATFKGVAGGVPGAETTQGISPSSVTQQYPASTFSNIASALTGVAGILADDDFDTVLTKLGLKKP